MNNIMKDELRNIWISQKKKKKKKMANGILS